MKNNPFPPVDVFLIEALERMFPNRLPEKVSDLMGQELARRIGQQEVINALRDVCHMQERAMNERNRRV